MHTECTQLFKVFFFGQKRKAPVFTRANSCFLVEISRIELLTRVVSILKSLKFLKNLKNAHRMHTKLLEVESDLYSSDNLETVFY
jgi:hypothetical protein